MQTRLLVLVLSVAAPQVAVGSDLIEAACAFTVKTEDSRFRIVASDKLHVLDQVSSTSAFELPRDAPRDIANIMCARNSPVPSKNDILVPQAGYPLYISAPPADGPNRVFVLNIEAGVVTYKPIRGILTEAESLRVESVLSDMNAAVAGSKTPET